MKIYQDGMVADGEIGKRIVEEGRFIVANRKAGRKKLNNRIKIAG